MVAVGASLVGARIGMTGYLRGTPKGCPNGGHIKLSTPREVAIAVRMVIALRSMVLQKLSFGFSINKFTI